MEKASLLAVILVGASIALASLASSTTPLSMASHGDTGIYWLLSEGAKPVFSPDNVRNGGGLLVILPGSKLPPQLVLEYAKNGGRVLLLGDPGYLKLPCTIGEGVILDEIAKTGTRYDIVVEGRLGRGVLHRARPLECSTTLQPLLESSPFSYLDVDGSGNFTEQDRLGPFTVAAGYDGIIVVSTPSLVYNNLSKFNRELILSLAGNGSILVDQTPFGAWEKARIAAARLGDLARLAIVVVLGGSGYAVARRL